MIFNPPISDRDTDELIGIAYSTDSWQPDAIEQAKLELLKRNVSIEYQQKLVKQWEDEFIQFEIDAKKELISNRSESYTNLEKLRTVFLGPLFVFRNPFWSKDGLLDLWRFNYKRKFLQRIILLTIGYCLWILIIIFAVKSHERSFQKEIDKADISEWERNRITNTK